MRTVMAVRPGKTRASQHPAHRPLSGLRHESAGQHRDLRNDEAVNNGAEPVGEVIGDAGTCSVSWREPFHRRGSLPKGPRLSVGVRSPAPYATTVRIMVVPPQAGPDPCDNWRDALVKICRS